MALVDLENNGQLTASIMPLGVAEVVVLDLERTD